MVKGRIARPPSGQTGHITISEPVNYDTRAPIFSLERLQPGDHCFSNLDQKRKAAFAEAIFRRSKLTWSQIKGLDRHGLGFEKIPLSQIKSGIPAFIKEDLQHVLAFRFCGLAPMVGYRVRELFYVLWFDHNFTLYDHD